MGNRSLLLAAALAALPAAAITEPGGIAASLRVPASEAPAFVLNGNGVYIYQCRQAISDPNTYVWAFVVPDATLYDGSHSVARHATIGLFESLSDRSSVSGVVRSSQPAGGANLPWVLIRAQPIGESGLFANVSSIQRVNTAGGAAPSSGCGPDSVG
ncbi:MAG TPA: DUF3455 domain-containing protein, partial [Usitatibacter sp.]|nr:DUF3455 domain-containing protein [Usitatibacter sp.]